MPICLTPHLGGDPIKLDKAILLIGRHPNCDIILLSSRKVSRIHCCIAQAGDRLLIRDLGSTNGVRVNGENVDISEIRVDDEVIIGDLQFRVGDTAENRPLRENARNGSDEAMPVKQFTGLDSAETPMVGDNSSADEYGLVEEPSAKESSYVELSDSHVDAV